MQFEDYMEFFLFPPSLFFFLPIFPEWPLWKSPVCAAGVSLTDVRVHVRVHVIDGQRERERESAKQWLLSFAPTDLCPPYLLFRRVSPPFPRRDEVLGSPARIPFFHHQPSLEKVASAQLIPRFPSRCKQGLSRSTRSKSWGGGEET